MTCLHEDYTEKGKAGGWIIRVCKDCDREIKYDLFTPEEEVEQEWTGK